MDTSETKSTKSKPLASSMEQLMSKYSSSFKSLHKGDIVEGTVKKLTVTEILLDIGAKGDALVIEYDKKNLANLLRVLKVGDKVKASVISVESEEGFPVVSLRRTLDELIFSQLESEYTKDNVLRVHVVDGAKGGYFVEDPNGIRGFLPNSQVLDSSNLIGKTINAKIIEFDREKKRIIFSQKATVYITDATEISKSIKQHTTIPATVQTVTSHGLYVVLQAGESQVEGFIHISEISHQRIEDLTSLYKIGDVISAQVVDIDSENRRVNLSIKNLERDSFEKVKTKYSKDQTVQATVTDVKSRGVTVEIEKGVNGFITSAKIPSDTTYEKGQTVEVQIVDFDDKKQLISLIPVLKTKFIGYR